MMVYRINIKVNLQWQFAVRFRVHNHGLCEARGGIGWEVGERFKKEGTYLYLWLIHVDVWQKPIQYCKAIVLQLKINKLIFKERKARLKSSGLKTTL